MNNIYNYNFTELEKSMIDNLIPKFRVKQIWKWLYEKQINTFDEMSNVDRKTIDFLKQNYLFEKPNEIKYLQDNEGTQKSLLELSDKQLIETVMMKQKYGNSVCVTTQVGCKIGCSFCASHLGGFVRNLSTSEIVEQVMYWENKLKDSLQRVSHIVIMGIGEPMDNFDNVMKFIDIINDQNGLKIGARHITLSTSGIVPKIYDLAHYDKQINLAISLHAPNNQLRTSIMKINKVHNIESIIEAVEYYIDKTNRRVSFEYIMLKDKNDTLDDAKELVKLLRGLNCHVNLIPFNDVSELELTKSSYVATQAFEKILIENKIQVSIRKPKGVTIDGACGQLRLKNV